MTHGGTATPSKIDKYYKTEGVTHKEIAKLTVTDLHVPAGCLLSLMVPFHGSINAKAQTLLGLGEVMAP